MLSPDTPSTRYPYSRSDSHTARSGEPTNAILRTRFRMFPALHDARQGSARQEGGEEPETRQVF